MRQRFWWVFALVVSATALGSCLDDDRAVASRAVEGFHESFNAREFKSMYASATREFRVATTETDWVTLLESVYQKAGPVRSATQRSSLVESGAAGRTVSITYGTEFERLTATERFSWRIENGVAVLLGYHIDAPDAPRNLREPGRGIASFQNMAYTESQLV